MNGEIVYAFSGTRKGTTAQQLTRLVDVFRVLQPDLITCGCCDGADRDMHALAFDEGIPPEFFPSNTEQMAWARKVRKLNERINPIEQPIARNRTMVNRGRRGLIACPGTLGEVRRSGTWATIRYAWNISRPTYLIYPDGRLEVR